MSWISFAIIFFAWTLIQCSGLKKCRDKTSIIAQAGVSFRYEEILRGEVDNFKLYVRINWTVAGANDADFDGFLVRLMDSETHDLLKPFSDCEASSTQVWIKTKECVRRENMTKSKCSADTEMGGSFCPCDKDNCPAIEGIPCSGTPSMLKDHKLLGFLTIPNTRRSIEYHIEFNKGYQLQLYLYQRQYLSFSKRYHLHPNWFCADTVAAAYGLSQPTANQICCLNSAPAIAPMDIQKGKIVLDKSTNTLNLTFSWIPPAPNELLIDVYSVPRFLSFTPTCDSECFPRTTLSETEGYINETEKCALDNRRQIATAYNLLPNLEYDIIVASSYDEPLRTKCLHGKCGINLRVRTDFDFCDTKWISCDPGFHCVILDAADDNLRVPETKCVVDELNTSLPNSTFSADDNLRVPETKFVVNEVTISLPNSTFSDQTQNGSCASIPEYCDESAACVMTHGISKPSCSCNDGLVGNGINIIHGGSGCSGCPLTAKCDSMATCIPSNRPSDGFLCRCDDAYYGDGLKSGSGCSSRARRTATIVVPIVLCGILLLFVLIWCLCNRRRRKYHSGRSNNPML